MKFLEKVLSAISKEEDKQDSPYKVSEATARKMSELNSALKAIENEILSIPATLELSNDIASEITVKRKKDTLTITIGFQESMGDYFIACEDTTSEEYEYFEDAESTNEVIDVVAEIIGKFISRVDKRM